MSDLHKLIIKITEKVYIEPLQAIGYLFIEIKNIKIFLYQLSIFLKFLIINKYFVIIYTIKFLLIPRFLLASALWLDIFYLNKIYLFYIFFWLNILPLIYLVLLWLVQKYCLYEKQYLEKLYNIKIINNMTISIKSKYNQDVSWSNVWLDYHNAHDITIAINIIQNKWYFLIFKGLNAFIFLLCWIYYLHLV